MMTRQNPRSVWQKPAVQPTEHAVKPGNIKEVSHAVPQTQSAAQPAEHAAKPVKIKEVLHAVPQVHSAAQGSVLSSYACLLEDFLAPPSFSSPLTPGFSGLKSLAPWCCTR